MGVFNKMKTQNNESIYGYPNLETYRLSLWIDNDKALYNVVKDLLLTCFMNSSCKETCLYDYFEALFYDVIMNDNSELQSRLIVRDVGSLWRVDWSFLVKHLMGSF